ncbi:response regulator [Nocardia sp. NPDC056000]|uniref:response regulator n=1 Tax=Nocardia sp. NPDC056000 TaxID=3345674 RepID=UPI0035E2F43E
MPTERPTPGSLSLPGAQHETGFVLDQSGHVELRHSDALADTCSSCNQQLPPAAGTGRRRKFCSTKCRSTARRARRRAEFLIEADRSCHCCTRLADRTCGRDVEYAIVLEGTEFRVCARCRELTVTYLIDHAIPAENVQVTRVVSIQAEGSQTSPPIHIPSRGGRILVIDDDQALVEMLSIVLRGEGYSPTSAGDGMQGLRDAYAQRPDLVVLDLMLPSLNGFDLLQKLRRVSDVPVIVLTAKSDLDDKVFGLTLGADDYLVKPFKVKELIARIARTLQRHSSQSWAQEVYDDGLLRLDSMTQQVSVNGSPLPLTLLQFRLLEILVRNAGVVQPVRKILAKAWDDPTGQDADRVKFAVTRLRRKLDDTELGSDAIVSARGIGYLYQPPGTRTSIRRRPQHSTDSSYGHAARLLNADGAAGRAGAY